MPAKLQPQLKLFVKGQQESITTRIHYPGRPGNMPDLERTLETVLICPDKLKESVATFGVSPIEWNELA